MWGTHLREWASKGSPRFIPTHVGNTDSLSKSFFHCSVHPHACGEHCGGVLRVLAECGSSPRMWGTLRYMNSTCRFRRFIPTHVGNTTDLEEVILSPPVHPHACGEHLCRMFFCSRYDGSSPRMWGTRKFAGQYSLRDRFIPTHVGNTPTGFVMPKIQPVHPHACGEHARNILILPGGIGSSPRMWGTPGRDRRGSGGRRFIPTHVGNTQPQVARPSQAPVHPHACGEHVSPAAERVLRVGSSPRMWGTRNRTQHNLGGGRFIPTHVGNTKFPSSA